MALNVKNKSRGSKKASRHKSSGKKAAAKKSPAKNATAKKATANKATAKRATKKAAKKTGKKKTVAKKKATVSDTGGTILRLDDLADVDDLVVDKPAPTPKRESKPFGPKTPSVPRSVKPPPKDAALEMDAEILAFVEAIESYRQENCRPFPTWTEVFFILRRLGYSKK
jgi:hypothetical protein